MTMLTDVWTHKVSLGEFRYLILFAPSVLLKIISLTFKYCNMLFVRFDSFISTHFTNMDKL